LELINVAFGNASGFIPNGAGREHHQDSVWNLETLDDCRSTFLRAEDLRGSFVAGKHGAAAFVMRAFFVMEGAC
jgi:hypothetical protein